MSLARGSSSTIYSRPTKEDLNLSVCISRVDNMEDLSNTVDDAFVVTEDLDTIDPTDCLF